MIIFFFSIICLVAPVPLTNACSAAGLEVAFGEVGAEAIQDGIEAAEKSIGSAARRAGSFIGDGVSGFTNKFPDVVPGALGAGTIGGTLGAIYGIVEVIERAGKPKDDKETPISCLDENNNEIDWFMAHKLPILVQNRNSEIPSTFKSGKGYRYTEPLNNVNGWQMSSIAIDSSSSIVARTLNQVYNRDKTILITYNDQEDDENGGTIRPSTAAHAKGFIIYHIPTSSAVWLIHSVPKFQPGRSYNYPTTGFRNGQAFMCLSLNNYEKIAHVADHLININANIIGQLQYPTEIEENAPMLAKLYNYNRRIDPSPTVYSLSTNGGLRFDIISKPREYDGNNWGDIWEILAIHYKSNINVQSWIKSDGNRLGPNPSLEEKAYNVERISIPWALRDGRRSYRYTKDHSKIGVTQSGIACVGDLNREVSQSSRGGGVVCFENNNAVATLRETFVEISPII